MVDRPRISIWLYAIAFMAFVIAALAGVLMGILSWHSLGYF